jgi:hypothetical protein
MLSEDSLFGLFPVIHEPDDKRPWREVKYADPQDFHKFVDSVNRLANRLANRPQLSPENAGLLFRAQRGNLASLKPSLWEELADPPIKKEDALRIEFDTIQHFKSRARFYLDARLIPHENDAGGWLALMQHYGAPTRMLDWTTSLNVSLYFAVARRQRMSSENDGAIWFFETRALLSYMEGKGYSPRKERYAQVFGDKKSWIEFGLKEAKPNIWAYYPDAPTDRMLAQKGILVFSEQPQCDYAILIGKAVQSYRTEHSDSPPLTKIIIPGSAKARLREYLIKIDVYASTLFPGLDGIGGSILEMVALEVEACSRANAS